MHACPFVLNVAPVIVDTEGFDNEQLELGPNKMRTLIGKPVWCLTFVSVVWLSSERKIDWIRLAAIIREHLK
jgi:hypothetical protein